MHTVDPIYFEHGSYLAPDQGGEKAYRLLSDAMAQTGRVARRDGQPQQRKLGADPVCTGRPDSSVHVLQKRNPRLHGRT